MSLYRPPVTDMRFALEEIAELTGLAALPGFEQADGDLAANILEEAGRLAADALAPLNEAGDREGCRFENGVVRLPAGFADAYRQVVEGGWVSLPFDPAFGGQGLPWTLALAVQELWHGANMSFGLSPLLTQGAAELLAYLAKLVSGEWTGTMNLTEPQAGSDLGAIRTRAVRDGGAYRISGQKTFITYGEHDMADNIVHMVLARTPEAPAGSKGLSLFIVPKFPVNADGGLGPRNDLRCVSIEHKLGINASPTCVMSYGDGEGATGFLLGEENQGLACMFTMMNNARLAVGTQGLAIAERAYQRAVAYARERRQGRALGDRTGGAVPIIAHPDVRRMLLTMKARIEAMRALAYYTAGQLDRANREPDTEARGRSQATLDLLTPVVKAWCTDLGCETASLGVQVHGGMGYIEETGAAQHFRDARINPIYEGTNGIQALDLVTRKIARDEGAAAQALIAEIAATDETLQRAGHADLKALGGPLGESRFILSAATDWLVDGLAADPARAAAVASPYLRLMGTVAGGWLLARSAEAAARRLEAQDGDPRFLSAKLRTARFYADNLLPEAAALAAAIMTGADSTLALEDDQF
jgi:alkylation response protein AidB-like acyl-CoA dehydrogenase